MEKQYLKYHIKMALFDSYKKLFFKVDKFINNLSFFIYKESAFGLFLNKNASIESSIHKKIKVKTFNLFVFS